ncbi:MAG TPA: hypothetical protein PK576_06635 [Kiritimatiellia bacterium]|nr:hypothetical protein [Kiritimatiellia bacterium]
MLKNAQRSTFNAQVSVQNLECGDKSRSVRGSRHRFLSALRAEPLCTLAQKAASRGIPLAAALQIFSPDLRSRRYTVKISASPRLCVIKKCNAICGRANKPDVSQVFAASTTIIDDVKAEIKRQEKRQKPDGVDVREEAVK